MNAKETEKMKEETTNHEKYFDLRRVTSNTPALFYCIPQFSRIQTNLTAIFRGDT